MPRAGLEPARTQGPRDFKSLVSTKFHHPGRDCCRREPFGGYHVHNDYVHSNLLVSGFQSPDGSTIPKCAAEQQPKFDYQKRIKPDQKG